MRKGASGAMSRSGATVRRRRREERGTEGDEGRVKVRAEVERDETGRMREKDERREDERSDEKREDEREGREERRMRGGTTTGWARRGREEERVGGAQGCEGRWERGEEERPA